MHRMRRLDAREGAKQAQRISPGKGNSFKAEEAPPQRGHLHGHIHLLTRPCLADGGAFDRRHPEGFPVSFAADPKGLYSAVFSHFGGVPRGKREALDPPNLRAASIHFECDRSGSLIWMW